MSVSGSCPPQLPHAPQAIRPLVPLQPPGWQAAAACAGLPPRVVFSKKVKEAAPALRACADCTVRRNCEKAVSPADSLFDGVCGGRLWRSGRPVPLPAGLRPATGTTRSVSPATGTPATGEQCDARDGGRVV